MSPIRPRSDASYQAVRRGHKRLTTVKLHTIKGGYEQDVPFSEGEVQWSLSDAAGIRSGRLTVPGYQWQPVLEPGRGTYVTIDVAIEGETWSLGEFPITRAVASRPRGTVEVTLGDWSLRRSLPDAEASVTIGDTARTVASVVADYLGHVLPGNSVTITRDDSNGAKCVSPIEVQLGGDVWSVLTQLANQVGCIVMMTSKATAQLRRFDPNAPYHDDLDGCLIAETLGIVADEAVNNVIVQAETSNPEGGTTVFRAERRLTTGPYKYDQDGIGELTLVETLRQPVVTQAMVDAEAQRIYDRRVGIVRSQQVETVPMPWLEVGDCLAYSSTPGNGPMYGMVDQLTFPLTARGTMRLTMRDTVVR